MRYSACPGTWDCSWVGSPGLGGKSRSGWEVLVWVLFLELLGLGRLGRDAGSCPLTVRGLDPVSSRRAVARGDAEGWLCEVQAPLLTDGSVPSRWPLGWGHCKGKDLHGSQMAKSRPGDAGLCRALLQGCRDPSAALATPQCLSPPQPCRGDPIGCFHGISCLPDLSYTPPIPRAFLPPPLASALNYNKSAAP